MHQPLEEASAALETLIEQHKSAVERYDLLGWPRPEVADVSGSGLAVDLGERTHGPIQLEFLLPARPAFCGPAAGDAALRVDP